MTAHAKDMTMAALTPTKPCEGSLGSFSLRQRAGLRTERYTPA
jgi:hypothetical protein